MSRRATLLLSALAAALLWAPASTTVAGQEGPGVHLTRNGFRAPHYGVSQTLHADGNLSASCTALSAPQIDAARIGRQLSRAMVESSRQVVVRGPEGGATFDIRYTDADGTGFNHGGDGATRRAAFEAALAVWSKVINAAQPIKVEASMREMDDGDNNPLTTLLATAGPTEFWVLENKAVPSALTWQILGGRFDNAKDADITVNVNDRASWDYALNGQAQEGKVNMVFTLMHELTHGLGMVDSFDIATGKLLNDPFAFVFDEFVNRGSSQRNRVMDHTPDEKIRDLKSRELFFNGANASEVSRRQERPLPMVRLYAPDPYEAGSSISHVDQDTYRDIRTGLLMTPIIGAGVDKVHPLTLAMMKDLGYKLVPERTTTTVRK